MRAPTGRLLLASLLILGFSPLPASAQFGFPGLPGGGRGRLAAAASRARPARPRPRPGARGVPDPALWTCPPHVRHHRRGGRGLDHPGQNEQARRRGGHAPHQGCAGQGSGPGGRRDLSDQRRRQPSDHHRGPGAEDLRHQGRSGPEADGRYRQAGRRGREASRQEARRKRPVSTASSSRWISCRRTPNAARSRPSWKTRTPRKAQSSFPTARVPTRRSCARPRAGRGSLPRPSGSSPQLEAPRDARTPAAA